MYTAYSSVWIYVLRHKLPLIFNAHKKKIEIYSEHKKKYVCSILLIKINSDIVRDIVNEILIGFILKVLLRWCGVYE